MAIKNIRQIVKFPKDCKESTLPLGAGPGSDALVKLGVVFAGISDLVEGYEVSREPRAETHMVLFTDEGSGEYVSNGRKYLLERGNVFICPCDCSERYYPVGGFWRKFWFHLKDSPMWEHLKGRGPELKESLGSDALLHAMRRFILESRSSLPEAKLMAKCYAEIIIVSLKRELGSFPHSGKIWIQRRFDRLWDDVNGDLKRGWTLGLLAKGASLSSAHLSRLCRERYGLSPMRMVSKLRLQRASEFLESSDMKLAEIAMITGYGSPFTLSTAFKREYGVSPKLFRRPSQEPSKAKSNSKRR